MHSLLKLVAHNFNVTKERVEVSDLLLLYAVGSVAQYQISIQMVPALIPRWIPDYSVGLRSLSTLFCGPLSIALQTLGYLITGLKHFFVCKLTCV